MVVNRDFNDPVSLQLKLRKAGGELQELSKQTGDEQAVTGYYSDSGELNVQLDAGDARLYFFD